MTEGDRVLSDAVAEAASDLARTGADLATARDGELSLVADLRDVDAQMAALQARREDLEVRIAAARAHEVDDERRIERDVDVLRGGLGVGAPDGGGNVPPPPARTFEFFVNGQRYDTTQAVMTGLQVKAMVVGWVAGQALQEEGVGPAPDRFVGDLDVVDLGSAPGPVHFFSVPSATFG